MTAQHLHAVVEQSGVSALKVSDANPLLRGASLNSQEIERGDLFVAVPGFSTDGLRYVPNALERGAVAVAAEAPRPDTLNPDVGWVELPKESARPAAAQLAREVYGRPDQALSLVGVTGTNGKSSVTFLLEAIGRAAGKVSGRIGTLGAAWADQTAAGVRTTPEAPALYKLLRQMADDQVDLVAMEVSSHALALHRVEGARFRVAAFLNLSRDHLDFHGDMDSYFQAKALLFRGLDTEAIAVLHADAPEFETLRAQTQASVLSFGRGSHADLRLTHEQLDMSGSRATLETPHGDIQLRTRLVGSFNLDNLAAAAGCALALDLPIEAIERGLAELPGIPGRVERIEEGQSFGVIVDYAHTDDALDKLLNALRPITTGKLTVLFGCGGDRDRTKRAPMGKIAAQLADHVILTSDNPRNEAPEQILDDAWQGVVAIPGAANRAKRITDRREAIRYALANAQAGDVIAIAGKGHEGTQTLATETIAFDDREVCRQLLREQKEGAS